MQAKIVKPNCFDFTSRRKAKTRNANHSTLHTTQKTAVWSPKDMAVSVVEKLRQAGRAVVEVGGVVPRTIMFVFGVCIRGYLVMVNSDLIKFANYPNRFHGFNNGSPSLS